MSDGADDLVIRNDEFVWSLNVYTKDSLSGAVFLGSMLHLDDGSIVDLDMPPEQTRKLYELLKSAYNATPEEEK